MSNRLKPIPKNPVEVVQDQITPYLANQGKPVSQTVFSENRGTDYSMRNDTVKDISIGLEDIDNAIMYYFNNVIKPNVVQNGQQIAVPVLYGSPERWKSVQKDGYYRDKLNKVMMPLIMIKRNDITKNRTIANKLDANFPNLYVSFQKQYSNRNFYSNFNVLTNRVPEREYYANVAPDYVTITYECMVMTYYMDQMNKIIEAINYASDSYWGDPSRFKFKAAIDTFTSVTELSTDQDRIVRSTFNIKLNGYIIPDVVQKDLTALKKLPSISKVTFTLETDTTSEMLSTSAKRGSMKKIPATFFDNVTVVSGGGGGTSQAVLDYLALNNVKTANTSLTTNNGTISTVTFPNATIETAPGTLPVTSVSNFSIYINGQYVESSAIVSLVQSGNDVILTLNNSQLGFGLDNTFEVVASGKFSN